MKTIKLFCLILLLLASSNLNAVSIDKLIGKSETLEDVKEPFETIVINIETESSCDCGEKIDSTADEIKDDVKEYVDALIEVLNPYREQIAVTKHELSNRTNEIENTDYYNTLNSKIQKITGSSNSIASHKLMGYNNRLYFLNNGFVEKNAELANLFLTIKSLEDIETNLILQEKE